MIATVAFDRSDERPDWTQVDTIGLQEKVMAALDRHFTGYDDAAGAQAGYRRVQADVANDKCLTLFGSVEAMRAGLEANPRALKWSAFEREAAETIAPFCFSIRFTE